MSAPVLEPHREAQNREHEGIDRYWGLGVVLLLASFLSTLVLANSALFYVRLKEAYDVDHGTALWPLTVMWISARVVGPLIYQVQKWVPVHCVALVGSVLTWLGLVLSGFAPNIIWTTISLGALHGAGMGIVLISFSACTATHFHRHCGTINGFKYVGRSAAGLLGPVPLAFLVDLYGLKRALILVGVVVMNITPLTLFVRTPQAAGCDCFRKLSPHKSRKITITSRLLDGDVRIKYSEPQNLEILQTSNQPFDAGLQTDYPTSVGMQLSVRRVQPIEESNADSLCSSGPLTESNAYLRPQSTPTRHVLPENITPAQAALHQTLAETLSRRGSIKPSPVSPEKFLSLLKMRTFYTLAITYVVVDYTDLAFRATLVSYAIDKGLSRSGAESLIMYDAIGALFGRLVLTRLLGMVRVRREIAYAYCLMALSATLAALSFVTSQATMVTVVVAASLPSGFLLAMKPVVATDCLGVQMSSAAWIVIGACAIPFLLVNPVITGYFRDKMGSFDNLYRLYAALNVFAAVLLQLQVLLRRCTSADNSEDRQQRDRQRGGRSDGD